MKTDAEPEVKKSSTTPQEQAESPHSEPRQNNSSTVVWWDVPSDLIRAPLVDIDFRNLWHCVFNAIFWNPQIVINGSLRVHKFA